MPSQEEQYTPDIRDLLAAFNAEGVRCRIIGGYAFGFRARWRTTNDIDVWVDPTKEKAEPASAALRSFGPPPGRCRPAYFQERGTVLQIGVAPNRIDLLTDEGGLAFEEAWRERVADQCGGGAVHHIGRERLAHTKRAAGRKLDLADLAVLERRPLRAAKRSNPREKGKP